MDNAEKNSTYCSSNQWEGDLKKFLEDVGEGLPPDTHLLWRRRRGGNYPVPGISVAFYSGDQLLGRGGLRGGKIKEREKVMLEGQERSSVKVKFSSSC
jgi:hypothetical protein